jgi:hypothetical protein
MARRHGLDRPVAIQTLAHLLVTRVTRGQSGETDQAGPVGNMVLGVTDEPLF